MNMMKLSIFICVLMISFLAFVHEGTSQISIIPLTEHPEYPGYCYHKNPYSKDLTLIKAGTRRQQSDGCLSVKCSTDYILTLLACDLYTIGDHCRVIKGDLSKPYPHCCDTSICNRI